MRIAGLNGMVHARPATVRLAALMTIVAASRMYRLAFRVDATQVIADEWAGLGTRRAVTPLLKVLSLSDDEATVRVSVS